MDLTQDEFDALLEWLDADRDQAGQRYVEIQRKLIGRFQAQGRLDAEHLADETICRVGRKVRTLAPTYVGPREPYFYATGYRVFLEYNRRQPTASELTEPLVPSVAPPVDPDPSWDCYDQCLGELKPPERDLIVRFYRGEKSEKIAMRKQLAKELKSTTANLRVKAHRIRVRLTECFHGCMERAGAM
jgi:DNA-directed RNA polymerase specialized sigma24 family protein